MKNNLLKKKLIVGNNTFDQFQECLNINCKKDFNNQL